MTFAEDDEDDDVDVQTVQPPVGNRKSNLKQSKTYESELDLVLEDLSECETATIQSDTESVRSLRLSRRDGKFSPSHTSQALPTNSTSSAGETKSKPKEDDQLLKYKLLNGCTKYQRLPCTAVDITPQQDHTRGFKSLPRNLKNGVTNGQLNGLISTLDNMGSWPRKLSRTSLDAGKESQLESRVKSVADNSAYHSKRRSLSPGKLKGIPTPNEKTEKIHQLIEEARRMSSLSDSVQSSPISRPTSTSRPNSDIDMVSPYASSNVLMTPPADNSEGSFIRQPSYKIACSNTVTPRKVLPRSCSEDTQVMKRNYSYRQANKLSRAHTSDSIMENQVLDTPTPTGSTSNSLKRAPSYRIAQTSSFERTSRAPSYRRALEMVPHETDSGLGSGDLTSSGSAMTSSSESNQSEENNGRQSSYRAATENGSKTGE